MDLDPLFATDKLSNGTFPTNQQVLNSLGVTLSATDMQFAEETLGSSRIVCHGVLRNVAWGGTKQQTAPSVAFQAAINSSQPVAVGAHVLDALEAFVRVQLESSADGKDTETDAALFIQKLSALVAATGAGGSDGVDQIQAALTTDSAGWSGLQSGGTVWKLPSPHDVPTTSSDSATKAASVTTAASSTIPAASDTIATGAGASTKSVAVTSTSQPAATSKEPSSEASSSSSTTKASTTATSSTLLPLLTQLNEIQSTMDAAHREREGIFRQLYGVWWSAIELASLPALMHSSRRDAIKTSGQELESRLNKINKTIADLESLLSSSKSKIEAQLSTGQTLAKAQEKPFGRRQDPTVLLAECQNGWPDNFHEPVQARMADSIPVLASTDDAKSKAMGDIPSLMKTVGYPDSIADAASHLLKDFVSSDDNGKTGVTWPKSAYDTMEDAGGVQGWFPLFMEWEIEYHHIPLQYWQFRPDSLTGAWHWSIKDDIVLSKLTDSGKDCRTIRGRAAIPPQSGVTLQAKIRQFLDMQSPSAIDQVTRASLLSAAGNLQYLSAPLAGLTDQLLTLCHGHYPCPDPSDQSVLDIMGVEKSTLSQLTILHNTAPYGSSTHIDPAYRSAFSPFKPVVHGQARFKRLTLIDKFGQVVVVVGPKGPDDPNAQAPVEWPTALYPCISPYLACDVVSGDSTFPNTAIKSDTTEGACQFFQVPPGINQPSRLNVSYLIPGSDAVASEWDNPVWGWLVANFVDDSIQVFNPDGTYVSTINCVNSADTVSETGLELPSELTSSDGSTKRLTDLVSALSKNATLAQALFSVMAGATDSLQSTGSLNQNPLSAAFGRPFCLADIGLSIELAAPPLANTSLLTEPSAQSELPVDQYPFQVALGNPLASFDGVVATFSPNEPIASFSSGFATGSDDVDTKVMTPQCPFVLKPYFVSATNPDFNTVQGQERLRVSCLMDSELPIHVYSGGVFPVVPLAPPGWAVQTAMTKMEAFFSAGPVLVSSVDASVPSTTASSVIVPPTSSSTPLPLPSISMPLASMAPSSDNVWLFLQEPGNEKTWDKFIVKERSPVFDVDTVGHSTVVDGLVAVQERQT
ncbi:hypothetical protein IL306_000309 [Fusarium sp. DS 682]|nr:hypothetical protein IL306_000309 [Fusarium sp. DS 682]